MLLLTDMVVLIVTLLLFVMVVPLGPIQVKVSKLAITIAFAVHLICRESPTLMSCMGPAGDKVTVGGSGSI